MRLLDVSAVLDRERDVQRAGPQTKVLEQLDDETAKYAILSHRWGTEVDYDEMTGLMKMDEQDRDEVRQRDGYRKIIKSCEQAKEDGYRWLWIDTCCIDKRSSAELSEAINSMYRWYHNSHTCYVYLNDVDESVFPAQRDFDRFRRFDGWPEWFSRGWTLQELIAPMELEFFNKSWVSIGNKQDLTSTLENITRIPKRVLRDGQVLRITHHFRCSVAQIMSWAADRKTTRAEDRAYSLMGLFGVNMPMLYGEGAKAFQRLQLEIMRVNGDYSIFAWNPKGTRTLGSVLAGDPNCFRDCHDIENVRPHDFVHKLGVYIRRDIPGKVVDWVKLLRLRRRVRSLQLSRWDVTNLGIQVLLPVLPSRDLPERLLRVVLPCCDPHGNLVTIDLASYDHGSYRWPDPTWVAIDSVPELKSLYFSYIQDAVKSCHNLRLHDRRVSWHGFTRCGTFPHEIVDNVVILSPQESTVIILVYVNNDVGSRFAIGFGYHLGRVWSHIICDEHPAKQEALLWVDFAKQVHDVLRSSPIPQSYFDSDLTVVSNVHLPKTIWDARVFCCSSDSGYSDMMVDIEQCPGCCTGPLRKTYMSGTPELWLPWTSNPLGSHELRLDGELAKFDLCSGQELALGDYGISSVHNFIRHGNIFEDMQEHGIDSTDLVYLPVVSRVSSCRRAPRSHRMRAQEVVTASPVESMVIRQGGAKKSLVLYQPKGLSLPDNEEFELLLKALSTRLARKDLVTTVIQCSELNVEERWMDVGGDLMLHGGIRSADQGTLIPLYTVARPLAWYKDLPCPERRQEFKNIREHFYALTNLHHLTGTGARHSSLHKGKMNGMVNLPTLFGLEHLKHYVGEITFFQRLPSIVETQLCSEGSTCTTGGNDSSAHLLNPLFIGSAVTRNLLKNRFQSNVGKNTCNEVSEAPLLLKKCEVLREMSPDEMQKTRREVESISRTLSVGLLEHIRTSFLDASEDGHSRQTGQARGTHYNMVNVRSAVQEIVALQTRLYTTQDGDEQRALEEDITGKIIWFSWCGVSSEVDQLSPKVLNHVRRKLDSMPRPPIPKGPPFLPSPPIPDYDPRRGFRTIAEIIQKTPCADRGDDMTHLQRIMLDAGAGVSKHELWLTARAAEQAKWRRVLRGDPAIDNQETGSSTSPEAPSTSIVHQELDTDPMRP